MSVKPFVGEPAFQLVKRMVRLIPRGVPVEVVANAEGPVGVVGKVGDFVEGSIEDRDAPGRAQACAQGLEDASGQWW